MNHIAKPALRGLLIGSVIGAAVFASACDPKGLTGGAFALFGLLVLIAFGIFGGIIGGLVGLATEKH